VWSISTGKIAMSAHIRSAEPFIALRKMTEIMRAKYGIFHTSIQVEEPLSGYSYDDILCDNEKIKMLDISIENPFDH
jgi:hypothetical protein